MTGLVDDDGPYSASPGNEARYCSLVSDDRSSVGEMRFPTLNEPSALVTYAPPLAKHAPFVQLSVVSQTVLPGTGWPLDSTRYPETVTVTTPERSGTEQSETLR